MKRRTSNLPILVYSYGCRPPTVNAELIADQLRLARKYRNRLIELELHRREQYRAIMRTHGDLQPIEAELEELAARLEELRTHIKAARKDARSRVAQPNAADQAKQARARLKTLRAEAKEIRAAVRADPVIQTRLEELQATVNDKQKQLRAGCGVYWGTYLTVEAAMDAARKSKSDPRFRRWDGTGKLAVQIQGGASVDDILHDRCQLLQIDPLPDTQWATRSGRRAAKTTVRIRVQSDEKGKPVWAHFPVLLHRPLPADGIVKNAWVTRRFIARKPVWQLQLTVEAASLTRPQPPGSAPVAAINLGWRVREGGLRVGLLVDEMGHREEIVLPDTLLARIDHAESLRAIRDRNLDAFRPQLVAGLKALQQANHPMPWVSPDELKTIHLWRSAERYAKLVLAWRTARADAADGPDRELFELAEAWRKQDLHLLQWQDHERDRALGHRREIYRVFAASLAQRYSLIVMDDFDLRRVARTQAPEEDEQSAAAMRRNRFRAAVSELRLCVEHRSHTTKLPSVNNTHTCHECGSLEQFDAAVHLTHTCSACLATWDQDYNAAKNLLRAYREQPPPETPDEDNDASDLPEPFDAAGVA